MQLIFIRHAEPDYVHDSLTPSGFREAECLARRAATWHVTAAFQSPHGRARDTAQPTLKALGIQAETCDWLREFVVPEHVQPDGSGHKTGCIWDLYPAYWTREDSAFHPEDWVLTDHMKALPCNLALRRDAVVGSLDALLARWGYMREGRIYRTTAGARRDATLVFFCHLGATGVLAGHVLNVSPYLLWHSFFLPPSSITVLNSEEREPGTVAFRAQVMGDTSHLREGGEPVSPMGGFQDALFQG